ncbi:MAG TPA: S1 RNA-binding domain-containing protein [Vicinamibacterales bacterium]|nr:S1 RNA-binding domain-containing protein [Vicinamibacterales bacterium]
MTDPTEDSTEDFATMFEASVKARRFERGQTIEGTIVAIGPEVAFVDVGGKGEATIEVDELKDDDGHLEVAVGDRVQAMVVSTMGGLTLSRRLARGAATARQLEDAFHTGLPVEGKVEKAGKGGYDVRIGGLRAFCPFSQIDTLRHSDPATHEGQVYEFRIIEYKEGGRNLVVSRRALLEEQQQVSATAVRQSIVAGAVMTGRVTSVREFGAFVDLGGGIQGLLHVSEMGWSRVLDAAQMVKPGEEITVKVLRVDEDKQKISLGLKQLTDDPWSTVGMTYEVGQVLTGRVTRVAEFGAFVELEPGVEALAHSSTFAPTGRSEGWSRSIVPGMVGTFEILSIEVEKKRIGVALVPEGSARGSGTASSQSEIYPGARITGKVERHEKFGVFVFLAPGRTGLMPLGETGVAKEGDIVRTFPVGSDIEVIVLEVDPSGRRIRVSAKAIHEAREAEEVREYGAREDAAPAGGFGSLADKLRGALTPRQK